MSAKFLVVGAGPSGLGCALELSRHGEVELIERIPVPGGNAGWEHPSVIRLTRDASRRGVHLRLGQTAMRYKASDSLLVARPNGFDSVEGDHLFFAGGLRPATMANLGADGDRPAGVFPATVAEHLLQAGVRLWEHAVIVGAGPWVEHVQSACRNLGTKVTTVPTPPGRLTVRGRSRVRAVILHDEQDRASELACDAVVLAADPRPNRNVEGALLDPDPGVTFIQPITLTTFDERYEAGRNAAQSWIQDLGGSR